MKEKEVELNSDKWFIQFEKRIEGVRGFIAIESVFHQHHDDGVLYIANPYNMDEKSGDIAICSYHCNNCGKSAYLDGKTFFPAGKILTEVAK
jgi:hypothetical protein